MFWQSEIYQFQRRVHAGLFEEKILKFEISMCDALFVQVPYRGQDVAH